MIEDIIAQAIADGAPVEEHQAAASRVAAALMKAGLVAIPPAPYRPKEYPKWVDGKIVANAAEEAKLKPVEPPAPESAPPEPPPPEAGSETKPPPEAHNA
jgi:hypothetical protein